MEIIEVPRQVFLALTEGFLKEEKYRLTLFVEELSEKKVFSCKEEGCGKPFDAHPPDDEHTIPRLEEKPDTVKRSYKCTDGHINTIWWEKRSVGVAFATSR